ncbi:hypothetical protein [Nocardiopsis alba]|uniref:Scaffolding protein n=1 Tax=Nocardiopsis alba TaxID=53437 RepID=A0A7K2ILU7_9ACTN|nr:hypothetical protein [Nocardiopsis alba]MYR30744.1 hypothetical protein [Nocardiopsis alba]
MPDESTGQEPAEVTEEQEPTTQEEPKGSTDPWSDPEKARKEIEKLRKEAASYRTKYREAEPLAKKAKELEDAQKTAEERLTAQLAEEQKRHGALLDRAVRAEVRALAADSFADPGDAAAFLDLGSYTSEDGDVDSDQIKADLDDLLKRKPHLGKQTEPRRPAPDRSQGSSGNHKTKSDPADAFAGFLNQRIAGR